MQSASAVLDTIATWDAGEHSDDKASLSQTIALLRNHPDPFSRTSYDPGHVTASAIVVSRERHRVALVRHGRIGRWVQPGGHVEQGDADLIEAARREVLEETGLRLDSPVPAPLVRIDVHEIPAFQGEPLHLHHDITFAFHSTAEGAANHGDSEWIWCPVDELGAFNVDAALLRSVDRALQYLDDR